MKKMSGGTPKKSCTMSLMRRILIEKAKRRQTLYDFAPSLETTFASHEQRGASHETMMTIRTSHEPTNKDVSRENVLHSTERQCPLPSTSRPDCASGADTSVWSVRSSPTSRTSSLCTNVDVVMMKKSSSTDRRIQKTTLPTFKATTVSSAAAARRRKTIALIPNEIAVVVLERNSSFNNDIVDSKTDTVVSQPDIVVAQAPDIVVSPPDIVGRIRADIVDAGDRVVLSGNGRLRVDADRLTPCLLPPTQISGPLSDVMAYVEVFSGSENRSEYIADEVRGLGATVCPRLVLNRVTHVIFREGRSRTLLRAWSKKIPVVSVLWVDSCTKNKAKVPENLFEITPEIALNGGANFLRTKSYKCMKPEHFDAEVVLSDDRVKKRAKRVEAFRLMKEITNYKIPTSPRQIGGCGGDSHLVQGTPPCLQEGEGGGENAPKTPFNVSAALAQKWSQLRDDCTPDTLRLEMVELRKRIAEFIESPTSSDVDSQQDTLSQTIRKKLFASPRPLCSNIVAPTITLDEARNNDVNPCENAMTTDSNSSVSIDSLVFMPKRDTVAVNSAETERIFATPEDYREVKKTKHKRRSSLFAVKTRLSAANRLQQAGRPSSQEFAPPVFIGRRRRDRSKTKTTNQLCSDQSTSTATTTTNQILPAKGRKTTKSRVTKKKCKNPPAPVSGLVMTSVGGSDVQLINEAVHRLGGYRIEDDVSESTSHVICGESRRTLNVLYGIARGCLILSLDWVKASLNNGQWVDEGAFYLDQFLPRQMPLRPFPCADLLSLIGLIFVAYDTKPPAVDMQKLIGLCGGKVSPTLKRCSISIGKIAPTSSVPSVTEKWLLDSIVQRQVLPFGSYRL